MKRLFLTVLISLVASLAAIGAAQSASRLAGYLAEIAPAAIAPAADRFV